MKKLGPYEFENQLLGIILLLGEEASATKISDRLSQMLGRRIAAPQLYGALKRLEWRGQLAWTPSKALPVRGGRTKKVFRLTNEALAELNREGGCNHASH